MMVHTHPSKITIVMTLVLFLGLVAVAKAVAQGSQAAVVLNRVEDQAFPQVSVSVSVSDENGPRDGLTPADFWIIEDGDSVPAETIGVESDTSQGTHLVLALDLSMSNEWLDQTKEAARGFIESLGPQDKVALIAFYDQVRVVQEDFTTDKETLIQAVNALTGEGNLTAFNEAAFEAVDLASASPIGRKAVVMVTNSANNVGTLPPDQVIDKAKSAWTPIYVIGFGDRIVPDALTTITTATGGRAFVLAGPEGMPSSYQAISELLRQGSYKVTFQSGLQADGAMHDLTIGVDYLGRRGQAAGLFTANPGQVSVNLPGLTEEQSVGGTLNLAVQAKAPAPIASVSYRLDGRLLAEVTQAPFSFEWDSSTLEPGEYRLVVNVVDQAGNQGQAEVNLTVVAPVVVTASIPETVVEVGDQVSVAVKIESLAEVARVELLLDGEVVQSSQAPPFGFSLDSGAYPAGEHLISVRAEDSLGRKGETDLSLQFLAPPPAEPKPPLWTRLIEWLGFSSQRRFLITVGVTVAALVLLIVNLIGLVATIRFLKRRRQRVYRLEISNLGNIDNYYALMAEEPMGALRFQFTVNGVPLPLLYPLEADLEPDTDGVEVDLASAAPSPEPGGPETGAGARPAPGQVVRGGGVAVDTLSRVGQILPGAAGTAVRRAARPVYQARSRVGGGAARVRIQAGRASRFTSRVGGPAPPSRGPAPAPAPRTSGRVEVPRGRGARRREDGDEAFGESWFATPLVAPGEVLPVDLHIAPLNPYRTQGFAFKVASRAVEPADSRPMVEEGEFEIRGISWFSRLAAHLVFVAVTAVVVLAAVLSLMYLGP
jgi:hypothetical protein